MRRAISTLFVLAAACGSDGAALDAGPPDAFFGPSQALFEVPRGAPPPSGFYALPFPNDIRVDDTTGEIDLSDHDRPNDIVEEYVTTIAANQRGFSIAAPVLFRFDNPIDERSLPQTPAESTAADSPAYLVDVDPDSPDRGARIPLRLRFTVFDGEAIGRNWLSVLPYPGFVLREQTTYAAVLTNRLRATDGSPIAVGPDFSEIAATPAPGDSDVARAQQIYQPLWDYLDEPGGDERDDIVSAAVFSTQDATSIMGRIRDVIYRDLPPPAPRDVEWIRNEGSGAAELAWYDGMFDGPNFQAGTVPYSRPEDGGNIELDVDGDPIIQRMEQLRFSFTVPVGTMPPAGWPVVVYAHGTGGSYHSFRNNGTAAALAAEGIAAISMDQVLHGPRNPNASPEISFFNFQNPLSARDNTLQGALDDFQLVRLVTNFDFTERHVGGRTVRFDSDRILFFGHSQGGTTGTPFLAHEPLVKGAVLSGTGGLLTLSLLNKTEPIDIAALVAALIRDFPLDEFNPILGLVQMWMDRADSLSYAPLLIRNPPSGVAPKHIFHSEGLEDRFTPVPSIEALSVALGVSLVEPELSAIEGLSVDGRSTLTAPVTANLGAVTGVLLQYKELQGSDGHFVLFDLDGARTQSIQFLSTLSQTGTATLVAP